MRNTTYKWIDLIAGLWLILSPYIFNVSGSQASNAFIVGLVIAAIALIRMFVTESTTGWLSWINAIAGFWMLISPIFISPISLGMVWNSIIVGIIVIAVSFVPAGVSMTRHGRAHGHP